MAPSSPRQLRLTPNRCIGFFQPFCLFVLNWCIFALACTCLKKKGLGRSISREIGHDSPLAPSKRCQPPRLLGVPKHAFKGWWGTGCPLLVLCSGMGQIYLYIYVLHIIYICIYIYIYVYYPNVEFVTRFPMLFRPLHPSLGNLQS